MLRYFMRQPFYKFSSELEKAFSLKFKVKDVTKIKGLASDSPYITI
jgi:hypothetical protein